MLLPELKRAKTRFISGLSAGIRERMLKPDICVYSVRGPPPFRPKNEDPLFFVKTSKPNPSEYIAYTGKKCKKLTKVLRNSPI
jgi:hypothetical protein